MSLTPVHLDPTGQVGLYQTEDRYFNLLRDKFGRRFLDYRTQWQDRSERLDWGQFPLSLDLAINSGCQLRCLMCPLPSRPDWADHRPMEEKLFDRLMAEAAEQGLPALTLGLGSEPLLNPRAARWIARAERSGIMDIRLGTNGLRLTGETAQALVDSGLTRLEISVDAARPESYQAIRGGSLERLSANIENFLETRQRLGSPWPLLRLSFLRLPQNMGELDDFLNRWEDQADLVSIQEPIWFPGSGLPRPENPGRPLAGSCAQPWQRLAVWSGGRVSPCCSWNGEELLPFDSRAGSIAAFWNSREMAQLRSALSQGPENYPPACRNCEF